MSLLSDILSRIKQPEPARDVPPGLRNLMDEDKEQPSQKKRIILLAAIIILTSASVLFAFHFMKPYLSGNKFRTEYLAKNNPVIRGTEPQIKDDLQAPAVTENLQTAPPLPDSALQPKNTETEKQSAKPETKNPGKSKTAAGPGGDKQENQEIRTKGENALTVREQPTPALTEEKPAPDHSVRARWLYLAQNYETKKDYPNAISSYKKVISLEPENFRAMNNIASILLSINSDQEAKVYLQKALWAKTDYVPALINMGIALARLGDAENAERYFSRVETLDAGNNHAILNLAILHEKQGRPVKARGYYTKLKQLGDLRGEAGIERIKGN